MFDVHNPGNRTPRARIEINSGGNTAAITLDAITLTYAAGRCRAEAVSERRTWMGEADSATGAIIALLANRLGYEAKVKMARTA